MKDDIPSIADGVRKKSGVPTASAVLSDGSLVEMVRDPEGKRTAFCIFKDGRWREEREVLDCGQRLVPYSPNNNLLQHDVVLLPSEPMEYESEEDLLSSIRTFIHGYVDVSPLFEKIASYYVLFSWVFDDFNELPYLRVRGDFGSGKTRFLLTVGSLCYKPIFAGASTISPLFRILDGFGGTLIIDEGDFRLSDEKAEVVKILNNGNARGFPVLRSEAVRGREFDPHAYRVFGPKLVGTRGYSQDRALESSCLTEQMGTRKLREGIPLSFGVEARREALAIRNQLLLFRFRRKGHHGSPVDLAGQGLEPRLAQILSPLLAVVEDEKSRREILELSREYNRGLVAERGMDQFLLRSGSKFISIIQLIQLRHQRRLLRRRFRHPLPIHHPQRSSPPRHRQRRRRPPTDLSSSSSSNGNFVESGVDTSSTASTTIPALVATDAKHLTEIENNRLVRNPAARSRSGGLLREPRIASSRTLTHKERSLETS